MKTKIAKKRGIRFFSPAEWKDEQDYLSEQHRKGWKFVKFSAAGYVFEECEPEEVVYQLDFRAEDKNTDEYIQMFKDCGWEYLQDYCGYSYFRKPAKEMKENEEGIFCDDESRLEMLQRVYRKKILPLVCIFFSIIIPQLTMRIVNGSLKDALFSKLLTVAFAVMFVLYAVIFAKFGYSLWKLKKEMRK